MVVTLRHLGHKQHRQIAQLLTSKDSVLILIIKTIILFSITIVILRVQRYYCELERASWVFSDEPVWGGLNGAWEEWPPQTGLF